MLLTPQTITSYLLEHDLLDEKSVVDGELAIIDASRRNQDLKVIPAQGPAYLVKQWKKEEELGTLHQEASVYQYLWSSSVHENLQRFLPHLHHYHPEHTILVLELFREAETLQQHMQRTGKSSVTLARLVGESLAALHRVGGIQELAAAVSTDSLPWILSFHRPSVRRLYSNSRANIRIMKIIQRFPEFCTLLDALPNEWQPEALIHNDIKWDNFLVLKHSSHRQAEPRLKLIDFEMAMIGDPCWDIGSVFSAYLSFWLFSIPVTGEIPPAKALELARYPLDKMQAAIRAFWSAYRKQYGLTDAAIAHARLQRAVKFAAARLLQTAYEQMQHSSQLTGNIIVLLQLSLNMLSQPMPAAVQLLGIPMEVLSTYEPIPQTT